jgi:hypothetical protein
MRAGITKVMVLRRNRQKNFPARRQVAGKFFQYLPYSSKVCFQEHFSHPSTKQAYIPDTGVYPSTLGCVVLFYLI